MRRGREMALSARSIGQTGGGREGSGREAKDVHEKTKQIFQAYCVVKV